MTPPRALSATGSRPSRRILRAAWRKYHALYWMFLPVAVFYVIFHYLPMGGILIAFKDYSFGNGIYGSPWAASGGLKHFLRFFDSGEFWRVFGNTLTLALTRIALSFPAPIALALLFNEVKLPRYKRVLQTISYLPHFVSFVVVYAILYNFFSLDGLINGIRGLLGLKRVLFLGTPAYYRWFFVGSAMWKEMGWGAIIYLAALSRVSVELYEAADIDGANRLQKLWHITLPEIRMIISIQFVRAMGSVLDVSFEQTLVMNNAMVAPVADTIGYYVYKLGILSINQYSYTTAIGLFNSLLALLIVLFTNTGAKRIDEEGGLW